jgi:hypothetical protein
MRSSINGEQEKTRQIRRTESEGKYIPDANFDREPRPESSTAECQPFGTDRNDGTPGERRTNDARERTIGGILRQLINEYRDRVAQNKNEINRLENRILELEALETNLLKPQE